MTTPYQYMYTCSSPGSPCVLQIWVRRFLTIVITTGMTITFQGPDAMHAAKVVLMLIVHSSLQNSPCAALSAKAATKAALVQQPPVSKPVTGTTSNGLKAWDLHLHPVLPAGGNR